MKNFILEPIFIFLASIAFLVFAIFASAGCFVFGRWSATLLGWY